MVRALGQELLLNNAANVAGVDWWTTTKEYLHFRVHANGAMVAATSSKHHVLVVVARVWKCVHAKSTCEFLQA
jgi:hypothetical protein